MNSDESFAYFIGTLFLAGSLSEWVSPGLVIGISAMAWVIINYLMRQHDRTEDEDTEHH